MTSKNPEFYDLDPEHVDPTRLRKEREKARELKKSPWWKAQVSRGICHYCGGKFAPAKLTMDHVIPLARGGTSAKSNLVPACLGCNREKKLRAPVDDAFEELEKERKNPRK